MTAARRFNWEAALVPCWGFLRKVPMARGLSFAYPFLVIAVLGTERTLFWSDLLLGFGGVSVGYGVLYGLAGDWMLARARARQSPPPPPLTGRRIVTHVLFTTLVLLVNLLVTIAAIVPVHDHRAAIRGNVKADLRNLVTAQEAYFADHSRFSASLDSLEYQSSSNVTVSIVHADSVSWAAEASYRDDLMRCRISYGRWASAPHDSLDTVPICDETQVLHDNH